MHSHHSHVHPWIPPTCFSSPSSDADASWHADIVSSTAVGEAGAGRFTFHVQRLYKQQQSQSQVGVSVQDAAALAQHQQPSRPLTGKTHWTFGCHMKGGGVDFVVDAQGVPDAVTCSHLLSIPVHHSLGSCPALTVYGCAIQTSTFTCKHALVLFRTSLTYGFTSGSC